MWERIKTSFKLRRKELATIGIVILIGLVYYAFTSLTNLYIPCVFREITGFACPGCGISHFFVDLFHGDLLSAVQENLLVAILLPIWGVWYLIHFFSRSPLFEWTGKATSVLAWICLAFCLIFFILRNLPWFDFLYPLYLRQ